MRFIGAILAMMLVLGAWPTGASAAEGCAFVFGFAAMHDRLPGQVGDCTEDERHDVTNGDGLQQTTGGLLVWRKADNITAFTDGRQTWLVGPRGLQRRLNTERFPWEANPEGLAIVATTSTSGAILPGHRLVVYYGNQLVPAMGVLGEGAPEQMLARLKQQADAFAEADPTTPVQTALELVTVVAQAGAGADGLYRARMSDALIAEVAGWAERTGSLMILDVQPGRSSVASEVQALLPYLKQPNVHLGLDPEFAMAPDQVPGEVYGSIDATTINETVQTLSQLVAQEQIPPKLLIVHRFREHMVTNSSRIQSDPRVQVVMDMDGFGSPDMKLESYRTYIHDQPVQYAGVKLFYRQDKPLFTPKQVLGLDPVPIVVIYQ